MSGRLAKGAAELHVQCAAAFKATPANFLYVFTLKDVARVVNGIKMVKAGTIATEDDTLRLWAHECQRVLSDRLTLVDQARFTEMIDLLLKHFAAPWKTATETLRYGDFARMEVEMRTYERLKDSQKVLQLLHDYQAEHNLEKDAAPLQLVFFEEVVGHLCRVLRVCREPGGHALLVGPAGHGKRSLCLLAAYIVKARNESSFAIGVLVVDPSDTSNPGLCLSLF